MTEIYLHKASSPTNSYLEFLKNSHSKNLYKMYLRGYKHYPFALSIHVSRFDRLQFIKITIQAFISQKIKRIGINPKPYIDFFNPQC